MHTKPNLIYHRDIRWPNIIKSATNPSRWFLIDWDDASTTPTLAADHLNPRSHHEAVFRDGHGAEVDVWAVGKLISSQERQFCPDSRETILALAEDLIHGRVDSADIALKKIQVNFIYRKLSLFLIFL
jgi:hypothetical protein